MKKLLILPVACIAIFTSCNKDCGSANPEPSNQKQTIVFGIKAASSSANQKNTPGPKVHWSAGVANASLVRFQGKLQNATITTQATLTDPINIFGALPVVNTFTIPTGTYRQASLSVNLTNNTNPALLLHGNYTDNTTTIPVDLVVGQDLVLATEYKDIDVTSNTVNAFTTVDMDAYTEGITADMLQNAQQSIGGNVIISNTSNTAMYDIIVNNITTKQAKLTF